MLGFYTHRISEAQVWIRCDRGTRTRMFWYVGQNGEGFEAGVRSEVERATDLSRMLDLSLGNLEDEDGDIVDELQVMHVAGAWSVDPSTLEVTYPKPGWGWLTDP